MSIDLLFKDGKVQYVGPGALLGSSIAAEIKNKFDKIIAFRNAENGDLLDLQQLIQGPITLEPITPSHPDYMFILRHDCEHVLAEAVLNLFPKAQVAVGVTMNNGFGYDFYIEDPFHESDLEKIETKMHEIIKNNATLEREVWSFEEAEEYYQDKDEVVKLQLLESLKEKGFQSITIYRQGEFLDLCRGPHGQYVGDIPPFFKLIKLSAAQWSGDKSLPIQRICGVLFATQQELDDYLEKIQAAKDRDHRKLGAQMDLYHIEEHSPGLPFWHPRGWTIINGLKTYIRKLLDQQGYMEVNTPGLLNAQLWKKSGHWDVFKENMFCVHDDDQDYALKPMSCPAHIEIFKSHFMGGVKSYASFPLRLSEFGEVYRNEATGALHGLKRVRKLTQDDGHIFCTPDQIEQEIVSYCELFKKVYNALGFKNYSVDLSTRPEDKLGDEELWDKAEEALASGAKKAGFDYKISEGEGAFYGPKLDFHISDSLDRQWQCSTVQLDFILPQRLEAEYVDTDGVRKHPVMIHRAVFGSLERFLAVLLENTNGYLPLWLAPVQAVIIPMNDELVDEAKELQSEFGDMRVLIDDDNEKLGYKIRHWIPQRAIYLMILGKKELAEGTITLRHVESGESMTMPREECIAKLIKEGQMPE